MFTLSPPRAAPSDVIDHPALQKLPVLSHALTQSPYLARLCRLRPDTMDALASHDPAELAEKIIARVQGLPADLPEADMMRELRQAKADIHLTLAFLDLSCMWDWEKVTSAFSRFADAAISAALARACVSAREKSWTGWDETHQPMPGLFLLALGKLGAMELNYSSDVDLVAMFDPDRFPEGRLSIGNAARRIIQDMARLLETVTEHGYVLRVDLRLRPDPRSTAVAISTTSADIYYESRGQNWERMAYIKARSSAGDITAADAFLAGLEPFVWRRHLDFWALEDIRAIKQQIHSKGGHLDLTEPEFDVKLGQGGIREIEFFAQTQQLIHGGRNPELRDRRTVITLQNLADEGHIKTATAQELITAYGQLRSIEHRIQMLNDDHTHTLNGRSEIRDRVAALCGYESLDSFDDDVRAIRRLVNAHFSDLFVTEDELSGIEGNLVFTGVDDDPGTLKTLSGLGFSNPSQIISDFQTWHRGGIRATRTSRGRQLLSSMERRLFQHMVETGNPDAAYEGLKLFLNGLSAGIQTLSLLAANPAILEDIISIFSVAPKMARGLGNQPELLEALLDGGFLASLQDDTCGNLHAISCVPEDYPDDFEGAMNEVRRRFRDEHFRIRYTLLHDPRALDETGKAFAHLADQCIRALTPIALREAERKLGPAPGRWAICGLGKLGDRNLTAESDLDLLVVFNADGDQAAAPFFTRATQRLITALSAQTEEGNLYEADMQLRPSGRAGPVAVKLSAFSEYYRKDAWTWEHMALTRLRTIAGDDGLVERVITEKQGILSMHRDPAMLCKDAWEMRERLLRDRPAKHAFDFKLSKGGMIDIEFLSQLSQLICPDADWGARDLPTVLPKAKEMGLFNEDELNTLMEAYSRLSGLLAFQRVALSGPTLPDGWPDVLKTRASEALGYSDFEALTAGLEQDKSHVWEILCRKISPETTEWGRSTV